MTMPDLVATRDVNALNEWLAQADPLEIAEELGRLPVADRAIPFRLLPKDRARLVDEMPAKVAKQMLAGLSQRERALTATLLGYPENSAGRVMSPEVVNLRANQTLPRRSHGCARSAERPRQSTRCR